MNRKYFFIAGAALLFFCSGCCEWSTAGIPAVQYFDAGSYAGVWYEIARMPNWFERGMYNVKAFYTLNRDGTLKVVNSGMRKGMRKEITGKAWFTVRPGVGALRVRFFFPFSGEYKIIYLNSDYTVAIVTGSTYSRLWILARAPRMSEEEIIKLVRWITDLGYESDQLIFTKQEIAE